MVRTLLALGLLCVAATPARGDDASLFAALASAAPGPERLDAAAKLALAGKSDALAMPALVQRLQHARTATDAERRAVLTSFGATLPGPSGVFQQPPRPPRGGPPPEPDWLAELARDPQATPAVVESFEAVAILRALGQSQRAEAAQAVLDFGFSPDGAAFRDECGRTLRALSPYSLSTLLRASQDKKRSGGSYARYSTYQLDRLDKGRPAYALAAAPDDTVEVAMLRAIGEAKHPDAVTAVLERTRATSHAVRRAARDAWLAYVTGPAPPPAPTAFRKMPGGKLSEKPLPLYLTYREFADLEVRRVLTAENGGTAPARRAKIEDMTRELFALYDQQRTAMWDDAMAGATAHAQAKRLDEMATGYDEILVNEPFYARRAEMVAGFLELGRRHRAKEAWDKAGLALNKALSLDPEGPLAKEAQAELRYARGMQANKEGKNADLDLAAALSADPGNPAVEHALAQVRRDAVRTRRAWMLYAGLGSGALALALGGLARRSRKR
jgi:hypothetical protein